MDLYFKLKAISEIAAWIAVILIVLFWIIVIKISKK